MDNELVATMEGLAPALMAEIEGLAGEDMAWRPAPDRWSVQQVVAHLLDIEDAWFYRLRAYEEGGPQALAGARPDEEAMARLLSAHGLSGVLSILTARRQANVAFVRQVPADMWTRVRQHPKRGAMTFHELLQRMVEHDAGHLNQIRRNKEALAARIG